MNIIRLTGGGIKLCHIYSFSTKLMNNVTFMEDSYKCLFVKAAVPGLGYMLVAGIHQSPKKPPADFPQISRRIRLYK